MDVRGAGVWTVLRIRVIGPDRKEAQTEGFMEKRIAKQTVKP